MTGIELWHNQQSSWLKEVDLQDLQLNQDEILVQSAASLVSQGSERQVISTALDPETTKRMAFPSIRGDFNSGNFTYGYSLVGKVVRGHPDFLGRHVHLLHPHQSYAIVKTSEAFTLPESINPQEAVLLSNLETIINALWDSQITIGDNVLIIGYGSIGALLAQVVKQIPGTSVTIQEIDPLKKNHSHQLFKSATRQEAYDLVFHTTATESGLQHGLSRLKKEGKLIELSWYGNKTINLSLGQDFHYDRKQIISSQVSSIPYARPHETYLSRKKLALKLLANIDFQHLITKTIPFSDTPNFFNELRQGQVNEIGTLITYEACIP